MVQIIFLAGHSEKHILGENATTTTTMETTVNSSSEEKGNQSIEVIGNATTTMKTTEAVQGSTGENDKIGNATTPTATTTITTTAPPHHQFDQQKHKHTKTTTADDSTLESENDNYKSNACRSKTIKEEIKHKRSNKTYTVWWCKKANGKKRLVKLQDGGKDVPLSQAAKLAVWAASFTVLHDFTLFVIDKHQIMLISLFPTPFDHFHPLLELKSRVILKSCLVTH